MSLLANVSRFMTMIILVIILVLLGYFDVVTNEDGSHSIRLGIAVADAHDHSRPDLDSWYPTLQSRKGPCCDGPKKDATHLDDPDWKITGDPAIPYRVRLPGSRTWLDVPDTAVVHEPNRDGRALVWPMWNNGEQQVRCFLAGTLS